MLTTHNLGFPRIGSKRELKFALEKFWHNASSQKELLQTSAQLRERAWQQQATLDLVPVGDFSLYDHVLDTSFMLGNLPQRIRSSTGNTLDKYFRAARGQSSQESTCNCVPAAEMTKWFDTNYHYLVPEIHAHTQFELDATSLLAQLDQAQQLGVNTKPVIVGPLTYLYLGKTKDNSNKLSLLPRLLPAYVQLLDQLAERGLAWVQIDEPILVTDLDQDWRQAFQTAYTSLSASEIQILLATYFGALEENLDLACTLPVAGIHIDAIAARAEVDQIIKRLAPEKILSLGVINGRNIWKTDLSATLDWLEPIYQQLKQRLWLAPTCSLLHVPVDLASETKLDSEVSSWLAFALQKLDELQVLSRALVYGRASVGNALVDNRLTIENRRNSSRVHKPSVQVALQDVNTESGLRHSPYDARAMKQAAILNLPPLPTTTIGSFPQTTEIRLARKQYRQGELNEAAYVEAMQKEIEHCVRIQEELGLDVLVHGEAERNDMVEYFGEQLEGYIFSQFGWVQSYGSRCVKPPIIYGDITRPKAMTLNWILYAQSLTQKPMKGMLTGPVTLLNWSFVRDDQSRALTCYQLALAIRQEVQDLEAAGIKIIQIDEAALREGLPLRRSQWSTYLKWAIHAFKIAANGVQDTTQIHTHMCYSEFNDIIAAIAEMDADVITIETSRSAMELLDAFDDFDYPNQIGPGVYDIHSPNLPNQAQIIDLMHQAAKRIPAERLWVNPDCGLKTRRWEEVLPALHNMVAAAKTLRTSIRPN